MTKKELHHLRVFEMQLKRLNKFLLRPVTAGEFAREYGISRNTARKYLEKYTESKNIHSSNTTWRKMNVTGYYTSDFYDSTNQLFTLYQSA